MVFSSKMGKNKPKVCSIGVEGTGHSCSGLWAMDLSHKPNWCENSVGKAIWEQLEDVCKEYARPLP